MSEWYRYPGPKPFRRDQAAQYHGREHDIEQLFSQVLLNSCTVMVGKSGVGKSSLINAGLLPKIEKDINARPSDNRYFRAIPLILQAHNPQDDLSLVDKVHKIIFAELGAIDPIADRFLQFLPDSFRKSINFTLKKYQLQGFLQQRKELFLLIFDQLEQLFSYPLHEVEALENELREIVNPNIPDEIRVLLEEAMSGNEQLLERHEIAMLENPVSVKFLFAIRSDRLSLLIRLRNAIPEILLNPYELKPMNRKQATKAIESPASNPDERFRTAAFSYKPSVVSTICDYIELLPNSDIEFKFYDGKIEPIILQIICRYIEEEVAPKDSDHVISDEEIDLSNILENYYDSCMTALHLPENELKNVRILLEEKLIYERDKRRLTFYEGVIKNEYKVPKKVLDQLTEKGLLRCITTVGFESSYEIAHDWLVTPVLAARQRRNAREQLVEDEYLVRLQEKISASKSDSSLLLQRAQYYATIGQYKDAIADYTAVISMLPAISYPVLLDRAIAYSAEKRTTEAEKDLLAIMKEAPELTEAPFRMGINCYLQKRNNEAIQYLTDYLQVVPDNANAINYLGIIALEEGREQEALEYFKRVIAVNPNYQIASYNLGVLYFEKNSFEEARKYFNEALALPDNSRNLIEDSNCWNYLGMIVVNEHEGEMVAGLDSFKKAVDILPTNGHAQFNLGSIYFDLEQWALALNCFAAVNEQNQNYARALNFIGRIFGTNTYEGYDLEKAFTAFSKAHHLFPSDPAYAYNLGWAAYTAGQWSLAQEWFEKAVSNDPNYTDAINYLGLIAENLNNPQQAIQVLKDGLAIDPQHKNMRYNLGRIYYDQGLLSEAKECMEQTVQLNAAAADAMNYLGLIEKLQGNKDQAIIWFTRAVEVSPEYHYPLFNLGVLYYDMEDFDRAIEYFDKTIVLDTGNVYAYNYLGLIAENSSKPEGAILNYQKAISINEQFAVGYYNLGIVLYKQLQYDESVIAFKKALKLKYQPGICCNYLGAITFSQNNIDGAIDYYLQALDHIPDYEYALFNLGESYFEKADFETSLQYWKKVQEQRPTDWEALWYMARCFIQLKQYSSADIEIDNLRKMESVPADKMEAVMKERSLFIQ